MLSHPEWIITSHVRRENDISNAPYVRNETMVAQQPPPTIHIYLPTVVSPYAQPEIPSTCLSTRKSASSTVPSALVMISKKYRPLSTMWRGWLPVDR
mmetsp:Transcript_25354/g.46657  ORF Transcript_25354/g.46657 Transcript_25354/m.46657 type:complete len:97 (+) Transcript_25354:146-436(+)